jgi:predicted PurR-regulated permease PerM
VRNYLDKTIPVIWKSIDKFNSEFSKPETTPPTKVKTGKNSAVTAIPVKVIESKLNWASSAQTLFSALIHMLITIGFVLLLVIFILINREDLKDRLMRLIANGRIGAASRAMEDASQRISHYLFMQLLVNISYGILVAIGLYFLGIPNATLWGGILALLRFIPYIGTWLAALIPIILSFVS